MAIKRPELSEEDLERVRKVTSSGVNSVERKPFKPARLLIMVVVVLTILSWFSIFLADYYLEG
jgi:hypothetical protein